MVTVYGNSITSGFTDGTSLVAIYTYGCKVWPTEESWTGPWPGPEEHYGDFYLKWTPVDASGTFFGGDLEDYSGVYILDSNYIPSEGVRSASISTVETTAFRLSTNAFRNCGLETASLPHCSLIGESAFRNCMTLSSFSAPECTWISSAAFHTCINLHRVNLPKVTTILDYAFADCYELSSIVLPDCRVIGSYAFRSAGAMTTQGWINYLSLGYRGEDFVQIGSGGIPAEKVKELHVPCWKVSAYSNSLLLVPTYGSVTGYFYVSIPELGYYREVSGSQWSNQDLPASVKSNMTTLEADVITLGGYSGNAICNDCSQLVSVSLSQCKTITDNSFENCVRLSDLFIPKVGFVGGTAFKNCVSLTSVVLTHCNQLASQAFYGCSNLSMIMLGVASYWTSGVCSLSGNNVFRGCTSLNYIYVPSSLYSKYLSAAGWSSYSDIIYSY